MENININDYLPGSRYGREIRNRVYTLNVHITGRCNVKCTYCHYYAHRDRKEVAYDMPEKQFIDYMNFIKYWSENVDGTTHYRFSGGDPIVLKDELFEKANLASKITGLNPFILTHGKGMNEQWVNKAKKSSIERVYISIENPINPDKGAQDPKITIKNLKAFNSEELPLLLGVCVVPTENYKNLLEICDWFYEEIGYIPPIAEINYDAYKSPTEKEWDLLEENLHNVISKYYGKTYLNLFHSVSPEIGYNGNDPYVFCLPLENKHNINSDNLHEKTLEIIKYIEGQNYPSLSCKNKSCDWWEFCDNTKWYWQGDAAHSKETKLKEYCRFKRMLNDTYYNILFNDNTINNKIGIFDYEKIAISSM